MAPRPRILVLLATFNGSRWIREQMESILAQLGVELTVVVRDDASSDGTPRELAGFERNARVRVSASAIPSGSAAQNFLTLMRDNAADAFDFVAFADQDDLWSPDKLRRACAMLGADEAAAYSSASVALWENGRERVLKLPGKTTASDFLFEGAGQGCTFVLTAAFYERVRRFLLAHRELTHQIHYHDWLTYALARSWGMRWSFDAQPWLRYRQHATNDTGARGTLQGVIKRLARIRDGWYGVQLRAIAAACTVAAPANMTVVTWHRRLTQPRGVRRALGLARFCAAGGRRRARDNAMVVLAAVCGWI